MKYLLILSCGNMWQNKVGSLDYVNQIQKLSSTVTSTSFFARICTFKAMLNIFREDQGLIEVHRICLAMQAIWRPTPCHDLGIDGQIEFLEQTHNVISTGKLVAVQVKSGSSYFKEATEKYVKYYPSEKHRRYWNSLNLPVILILHNPDTSQTIYTEVKSQLNSKSPMLVPLKNRFNQFVRKDIMSLCIHVGDPIQVLRQLQSAKLEIIKERKYISGIEFLLACLDPYHEYFEMRMTRIVTMIEISDDDTVVCHGSNDINDFIQRCLMICLGARISESFSEIYDHQWYDLHLVPEFLVPLTPFGIRVADYLSENADELVSQNSFSRHQLNNGKDVALLIKKVCQKASEQLDQTLASYS